MQCRTCDYSLFNLVTRACPECGAAFKPSEYTFLPNAVRFCCPHCDQPYYGTDESGHLVPRAFTCVSCGEAIEMEAMVLRPAEGVTDRQTIAGTLPWLDRKDRNVVGAWFRTVGRAMVRPLGLARAIPEHGGTGEAWWFAIVTFVVLLFCGAALPLCGLGLILAIAGSNDAEDLLQVGVFLFFGLLAGALATAAIWALLTHFILRITGGAPRGLGRTFQAILYSSGANVPIAVPCLGLYPFGFIGPTWWIVSATIMMQEAHRMKGVRAVWATLAFPILVIILGAGGFFSMMVFTYSAANVAWQRTSAAQQQAVGTLRGIDMLQALIADGTADGQWPLHAAELTSGPLAISSFVIEGSGSNMAQAPLGGTDFTSFGLLSREEQRTIIDRAVAQQPADLVAHRVGDFVFTYHGIDPFTADGRLWLFVASPDPSSTSGPVDQGILGSIIAGRADGSMRELSSSEFQAELDRQNELRRRLKLAPIPLPWTVTSERPAVKE